MSYSLNFKVVKRVPSGVKFFFKLIFNFFRVRLNFRFRFINWLNINEVFRGSERFVFIGNYWQFESFIYICFYFIYKVPTIAAGDALRGPFFCISLSSLSFSGETV